MEAEMDKEVQHFQSHDSWVMRKRGRAVVFGLLNCSPGCLSCFTRLRHIALTVSDASMVAFR